MTETNLLSQMVDNDLKKMEQDAFVLEAISNKLDELMSQLKFKIERQFMYPTKNNDDKCRRYAHWTLVIYLQELERVGAIQGWKCICDRTNNSWELVSKRLVKATVSVAIGGVMYELEAQTPDEAPSSLVYHKNPPPEIEALPVQVEEPEVEVVEDPKDADQGVSTITVSGVMSAGEISVLGGDVLTRELIQEAIEYVKTCPLESGNEIRVVSPEHYRELVEPETDPAILSQALERINDVR